MPSIFVRDLFTVQKTEGVALYLTADQAVVLGLTLGALLVDPEDPAEAPCPPQVRQSLTFIAEACGVTFAS